MTLIELDSIEINDSPNSHSSFGHSMLSKDFPFADFIVKEFMTLAFKNQVKDVNFVGSI